MPVRSRPAAQWNRVADPGLQVGRDELECALDGSAAAVDVAQVHLGELDRVIGRKRLVSEPTLDEHGVAVVGDGEMQFFEFCLGLRTQVDDGANA